MLQPPPPPGLTAPDSLPRPSLRSLEVEIQRLHDECGRFTNECLEMETARLAHENALLRAQLQYQMIAAGPVGPPGVWAAGAFPRLKASLCSSGRESISSQCSTAADSGESSGEDEHKPETTVLARNIPGSYSRNRLTQLLDEHGFSCLYDLVYLPIDFASGTAIGYAFINFVTEADAKRFRKRFDGFSDWGDCAEQVCDTRGSASRQGLAANIARYRNSPVMHKSVDDEFRPAIFENGKRVPFPPPTQSVKAPSLRKRDPDNSEVQ